MPEFDEAKWKQQMEEFLRQNPGGGGGVIVPFTPGTFSPPQPGMPAGVDFYSPKHADEKEAFNRYDALRVLLGRMIPDQTTTNANIAMRAHRGAKQGLRRMAGYTGLEGTPRATMAAEATRPAMEGWVQEQTDADARYHGLLNQLQRDRLNVIDSMSDNALWWDQTRYQRDLRDRARQQGIDWSQRKSGLDVRNTAINSVGRMLEGLADYGKEKSWWGGNG